MMAKIDKPTTLFVRINKEFAQSPLLSPKAKTVYLYLRSFDPSFPGYDCIMKATQIGSRSTLSKVLRELEILGWIIIHKNGRSNLYEFPYEQYQSKKSVQYVGTTSPKINLKPVHPLDSNKILNKINNKPEPTPEELAQLARDTGFPVDHLKLMGSSE